MVKIAAVEPLEKKRRVRRRRFTIVAGSIALFLVGVGSWLMSSCFTTPKTVSEECLQQDDPSPGCIQILVEKDRLKSSACLKLADVKLRGACLYYGARNAGDSAACDSIQDAEWLSFCRVVLQQDPSSCDSLGVAGAAGEYWITRCYEELAKITGNLSLCDHVGGPHRDVDCYQGVASYQEDIKICERLESGELVRQCASQFQNFKKGY